MRGPVCDVCGSSTRVTAWTVRPDGERARRRFLCEQDARGLVTAYESAKAPQGAASIVRRTTH